MIFVFCGFWFFPFFVEKIECVLRSRNFELVKKEKEGIHLIEGFCFKGCSFYVWMVVLCGFFSKWICLI